MPVASAQLWSLESPYLYTARAEVLVAGGVVDRVETTFGIRSIAADGRRGLLLNGEPVKLLGANVHHDHGPLGAMSLRRSEERRVEILKAAGFNAIRTAHNPHSPALLDACDRLGMLVWDEFSDMWDAPVTKPAQGYWRYFAQWWQQDLQAMVLRDRNHPSVVIWSLGNEIFTDTNDYGPQMASLVRTLDTTRPVTLGGMNVGPSQGTSPWSYCDIGDVHYSTNYSANHASYPGKAFTQSESFPTTMYDDWRFTQENPWVIGYWVWAGWDYIGEAAIGATPFAPSQASGVGSAYGTGARFAVPYPWYVSGCGDIDLIGQRRPQAYLRAVVCGLSDLEMAVERPAPEGSEQQALQWSYYDELQSWTWDVPQGQAMKVRVYTSGDSVKLLLNESEVATNHLAGADKQTTTFSVPYAPGTLTAIASRAGREIARKTLDTAGAPAKLRLVSDVPRLTTDRDELAHVLVEVLDAEDRLVPDAVVPVSFAVGGAGELAGVANANPHNVDSFRQPHRYTYHGKALAILRPAKRPGHLTLQATAPGLQSASLGISVVRPALRALASKRAGAATRRVPARVHRGRWGAAVAARAAAGPAGVLALLVMLITRGRTLDGPELNLTSSDHAERSVR